MLLLLIGGIILGVLATVTIATLIAWWVLRDTTRLTSLIVRSAMHIEKGHK